MKNTRKTATTAESDEKVLGRFLLYELAMREAASRAKKSLRDIEKVLFDSSHD